MLANRMALAIPAFVDLFTRHLQHLAFAITQIIGRYREHLKPDRAILHVREIEANRRDHERLAAAGFRFRPGQDCERWGNRNQSERENHDHAEHELFLFLPTLR